MSFQANAFLVVVQRKAQGLALHAGRRSSAASGVVSMANQWAAVFGHIAYCEHYQQD